MRALVLLALLSVTGSEASLHEDYLDKLEDACRAFGGVRGVWYDTDALHGECVQGFKVTLYTVDEAR